MLKKHHREENVCYSIFVRKLYKGPDWLKTTSVLSCIIFFLLYIQCTSDKELKSFFEKVSNTCRVILINRRLCRKSLLVKSFWSAPFVRRGADKKPLGRKDVSKQVPLLKYMYPFSKYGGLTTHVRWTWVKKNSNRIAMNHLH